uniref:Uncharacterized protein n=1 Tax=Populus alba TaxID=43335 RepID=A0A4V6A7V5_POPAL|nr:hypothetical protein D5086_0000181870 [Populus alba]
MGLCSAGHEEAGGGGGSGLLLWRRRRCKADRTKAALSVTGATPGGRWPSLLMAEKGVDGSTGRDANSWGAAEREAGDKARGEERFGFVGEGRGKSGRPIGLSGWPVSREEEESTGGCCLASRGRKKII